jgi:protein Tex
MDPKYLQHIAKNLNLSIRQIANIFELQSQGATIPFIARYRKEATGNLDEVVINRVVESIIYFLELEKRKETIIKTIDGLGKLNEPLKHRIEGCFETTELEDIYLPYKPKRKTRAAVAIEKGLESLAKFIFEQTKADPEAEARKYCNEFVKEIKEAIEGARDIIAEWISENEHARNLVRRLFAESAILTARVMPGKKEEAETQRYRDYFDYREPLKKLPFTPFTGHTQGGKRRVSINGDKYRKGKSTRRTGGIIY